MEVVSVEVWKVFKGEVKEGEEEEEEGRTR